MHFQSPEMQQCKRLLFPPVSKLRDIGLINYGTGNEATGDKNVMFASYIGSLCEKVRISTPRPPTTMSQYSPSHPTTSWGP